jgi:pyoverdine/dityrosine biosynthesis protein Dit1
MQLCRKQQLTRTYRHDNAGPKFGIRLLGSDVCATNALSVDGEVAVGDDLHIPTPWHGCIVQVEGDAQLYMTKAHVAKSALSSGGFSGSWLTSGKEASQPGYYWLRRN